MNAKQQHIPTNNKQKKRVTSIEAALAVMPECAYRRATHLLSRLRRDLRCPDPPHSHDFWKAI